MKKVIITGASRGIGLALAHKMQQDGHRVALLSRKEPQLPKSEHIRWFFYDMNEPEANAVAKSIIDWMGGEIDVLIHNAGHLVNKAFADIQLADLQQSYAVNVFGPFMLTQKLLPALSNAHIIGISSMGGVNGSLKFPGLAAYSSSKGALITLFELLQEELGKEGGPVFNVLALGAVQTEMLTQAFPGYKAPLQADEMAEFISWFALNGQKYFKGKTLPVSVSNP